jgi:ketosteroid isomerase-like protein
MSQENVEVVRRGNAAFNRGDYEGFAESLHPDVEFRDHAHAADAPEALKGAQALRSLLSEWRETFDDFRAEISEYIEAGDHVVCVTRWTGWGKASDAAVDVSQVDVYQLREGKIVRVTLAYPDKKTALEAGWAVGADFAGIGTSRPTRAAASAGSVPLEGRCLPLPRERPGVSGGLGWDPGKPQGGSPSWQRSPSSPSIRPIFARPPTPKHGKC